MRPYPVAQQGAAMSRQWSYYVVAKGWFGGYEACLLSCRTVILLAGGRFGSFERKVLRIGSQMFDDWLDLCEPCQEVREFQGDDDNEQTLEVQWVHSAR